MTTNLPEHYTPNLPRVSELVEWAYPFKGTEGEQRFHKWLKEKNVSLLAYMKEASTGGTYVHKCLEEYCLGKQTEKVKAKYKEIVENGIRCIKTENILPISTEVYIRTDKLQGSADLVATIDGKKWLLDYKTYNLSKYKFGLHNGKYTKPYDKLKKATLQLSIYAHSLGIKNIAVIELNKEGYYFHILKLISKKEINKLIKEYYLNYLDEL